LAHVAALREIDAVQFLEAVLEQDGFFDFKIAAAVGHAKREAVAVVRRRVGARETRRRNLGLASRRNQKSRAERWQTRIAISDAAGERLSCARRNTQFRQCLVAPRRRDDEPRARISEGYLGAQFVKRQPAL